MYTQGDERPFAPKSAPGAKVIIRTPTERDRRKLSTLAASSKSGELDAKGDPAGFVSWCETVVNGHVMKVEGYVNRGKTPTTAGELLDFGAFDVIAEVAAEIYSETSLDEDARKNSGAPSDT